MEPQNEFDVESNIQPMVATSPSLDTQPTSRKVGLIGVGITFGVNDKGQVLILDTVKGSPAGSCPIVAKGDIIVSIVLPSHSNLKLNLSSRIIWSQTAKISNLSAMLFWDLQDQPFALAFRKLSPFRKNIKRIWCWSTLKGR